MTRDSGAAIPPAARLPEPRGGTEKKMEPQSSSKRTELDNALAGQVGGLAEAGNPTDVEPDTAEMMGAFEEDALSVEEALESRFDKEIPARGDGNE